MYSGEAAFAADFLPNYWTLFGHVSLGMMIPAEKADLRLTP